MSNPLIAAVELLARSGRTFEAQISGISMGESIRDGAHVRIEPVTRVRRGDVVAFRDNDRIVAHRVCFRARGYLIIVGDGYEIPDLPVKETSVIGRVVATDSGGAWGEVPFLARRSFLSAAAVTLVSAVLLISPRLAERVAGAMIVFRRHAGATSNA